MVASDTHANQHLAALARHLKLAVAPPPDQPPGELMTSSGPDFDRHYVGLLIAAQQNAISLYESEAKGGQHPRAKHFARGRLPELRHHLRDAQMLGHKLGI